MSNKYDIFISYSRKDMEVADKICAALDRADITYFIDRQGISGGQEFPEVLSQSIKQSRLFLFLASENSYASKFTINEITYAFNKKQRNEILPYIIDGSTLPEALEFVFAGINWRTLSEHPIEPTLINDLQHLLGKEVAVPQEKPKQTTKQQEAGAEIHIEVDADCELFRFKERLALLRAGEDNVVRLMPGNHRLRFVSVEAPNVEMTISRYNVPSENYSDIVDIQLLSQIQAKRREQEEARKAEEARRLEAERKVQKAKARKEAEQLYLQAKALYDEENYDEAFPLMKKAAEQGNADAQYYLGDMYGCGYGVTWDSAESDKWNRKAAEQGNADAQWNLGFMYYYGDYKGDKKDFAEAVKWFRKAAEQGHAYAQSYLGTMYEEGYGVKKDYAEAVKWYRKAAEQGNNEGQYFLGDMYYNGYGVTKDYAEAVKWYRIVAEQGIADGQYKLGFMYYNGYGVTKNYAEAIKWYRKAAGQGYADAKKALKQLGVK